MTPSLLRLRPTPLLITGIALAWSSAAAAQDAAAMAEPVVVAPAGSAADGPLAAAPEVSEPPQGKMILSSAPPPPPEGRAFHYHDGFYLRTALSYGINGGGLTVGDGDSQRSIDMSGSGLDLTLLVGGTPSPGLSLGGGLMLGTLLQPKLELDGTKLATSNVGMVLVGPFVDGFPNRSGGLHLGGLVGLAGLGKTSETEGSVGLGGAVWAGYDTWVGDDWALGGQLRFMASAGRGNKPTDFSTSLVGLSLGFSVLYQ